MKVIVDRVDGHTDTWQVGGGDTARVLASNITDGLGPGGALWFPLTDGSQVIYPAGQVVAVKVGP